jgi:hypothetical protein
MRCRHLSLTVFSTGVLSFLQATQVVRLNQSQGYVLQVNSRAGTDRLAGFST